MVGYGLHDRTKRHELAEVAQRKEESGELD
jgi:hypothetical protein